MTTTGPNITTGTCPKCNQPWKRTVETIAGNVYTSYDTSCTCPACDETVSLRAELAKVRLQALTYLGESQDMYAELLTLRELVEIPYLHEDYCRYYCTWCNRKEPKHNDNCPWLKWKETYGR